MSHFELAVAVVLAHEGGYSEHPADPGGATNFGVSLRWLRNLGDNDGDGWLDGDLDRDGDVDPEDIRLLTAGEAANFYRVQWWERYGYERIEDQGLATKLLDMAVNVGHGQAVRLLQRAIGVQDDGILGPRTLAAANARGAAVLPECRFRAVKFYLELGKPGFLDGWLRRAVA